MLHVEPLARPLVASVLALAWLACAKDETKSDATKESSVEARDREAAAKRPPPPERQAREIVADAPGPAYFAVRRRGLVMLDADGFSLVEDAPDSIIRSTRLEGDGYVYLLGPESIMRVVDGVAETVAETTETLGILDDFAVVKGSGEIWAIGDAGLFHWDGTKWGPERRAVVGGEESGLRAVFAEDAGRVWVGTHGGLFQREDGRWSEVDTTVIDRESINSMARGPEGNAYVLGTTRIGQADPSGALDAVAIPGVRMVSLEKLALSGVGHIACANGWQGIITTWGGATRRWNLRNDLGASKTTAVAVDGRGRVWAATDVGVFVLGPEEARTEWRSGSVDELVGDVDSLTVVGSGPEIPGPAPTTKTATIRGGIQVDGKPVAETRVEVCPSPGGTLAASPCGRSTPRFEGTTDSDGSFEFHRVPIGLYGVAAQLEGGWKWRTTFDLSRQRERDGALDLGVIDFKSR